MQLSSPRNLQLTMPIHILYLGEICNIHSKSGLSHASQMPKQRRFTASGATPQCESSLIDLNVGGNRNRALSLVCCYATMHGHSNQLLLLLIKYCEEGLEAGPRHAVYFYTSRQHGLGVSLQVCHNRKQLTIVAHQEEEKPGVPVGDTRREGSGPLCVI